MGGRPCRLIGPGGRWQADLARRPGRRGLALRLPGGVEIEMGIDARGAAAALAGALASIGAQLVSAAVAVATMVVEGAESVTEAAVTVIADDGSTAGASLSDDPGAAAGGGSGED